MQNSQKDQGKYAEFSTQNYLGDLIFGNAVSGQVVPYLSSHFR